MATTWTRLALAKAPSSLCGVEAKACASSFSECPCALTDGASTAWLRVHSHPRTLVFVRTCLSGDAFWCELSGLPARTKAQGARGALRTKTHPPRRGPSTGPRPVRIIGLSVFVRVSGLVSAHQNAKREMGTAHQTEAVGERAAYGRHLIAYLSERLTAECGRGFSERTLREARQFYRTLPICRTVCQIELVALSAHHVRDLRGGSRPSHACPAQDAHRPVFRPYGRESSGSIPHVVCGPWVGPRGGGLVALA